MAKIVTSIESNIQHKPVIRARRTWYFPKPNELMASSTVYESKREKIAIIQEVKIRIFKHNVQSTETI